MPVLFITGHGTTETAIEAMKRGAFNYLLKPLELTELRAQVGQALEVSRGTRAAAPAEAQAPTQAEGILVGRCPAMQEVYKAIGRVAPLDVTVLIRGESGTGKELAASAIHRHSARAAGPFVAINCAAITDTLLESELFGHEKGAFTGADSKRLGKFEQCAGGTLFLDEIGDMAPLTQAKVLRVLQDGRFERVGGNETIDSNVRIVAATHRNLEELVAAGHLRGDLYYRLNVVTIELPPLRERGDDLPLLVDHFLARFCREMHKEPVQAAPETLLLLREHAWPGNLRELQSVLKQALLHATGTVLLPDFLPASLRQQGLAVTTSKSPPSDQSLEGFVAQRLATGCRSLYADWLAVAEKRLLIQVLQKTGGNQVQAARVLGISRNGLRAKIKTLGIRIERLVGSNEGRPSGDAVEG
jgi:two-component system nitrogen regulation response regulator GlnG